MFQTTWICLLTYISHPKVKFTVCYMRYSECNGVFVTDLLDLKELVTEAEEKKFPDTPLMQTLVAAISEAEKCASVANQLVCKKVRTR